MTDKLQINTGVKRLEIERDGEAVGVLEFNPNDTLFAEKFYAMTEKFQEKQRKNQEQAKELESDKGVDENGVPLNVQANLDFQKDLCNFCYEQIDAVFGSGTSEMVFGDALNIESVFQFFEGITPHFQRARNAKVAKYTPKKK